MLLTAWQTRHTFDETASRNVGYLLASLLPLTVVLVWRLRCCWLFALLLCLAQLWLALAVMIAVVLDSAPALRLQ